MFCFAPLVIVLDLKYVETFLRQLDIHATIVF